MQILGEKSGAFEAEVSVDIEDLEAENLGRYDVLVLNNNCSVGPRRNRSLLDGIQYAAGDLECDDSTTPAPGSSGASRGHPR